MTLSIWRYAHLALAIISSVVLLLLSLTGVVLAIAAVGEKTQSYKVDHFETINLAQSIPALSQVYPEIIELSVDHNQFVSIDATDQEGNSVKAYIHPLTGEVLGQIKPQSDFIQWNIALHRSLFLKETGRIIVGVVSFLLVLITLSGVILIVKRQQGWRNFGSKINKDFFSQYYHVVSGRIFLIPVFILALTGTYLLMVRLGLTEGESTSITHAQTESAQKKDFSNFEVFKETQLADLEKVEFPFMPEDEEEFFIVRLKDRELAVNQITGAVVSETRHPYGLVLEKLSLDLHTGKTNAIWAIILGLASLNILVFIYTGFDITLRRSKTKIKNKYTPSTAEYILLVGSENGSTLTFAHKIHQQLLALGHKSYLTEMNRFTHFEEAKHLLIFTSTYGLGTAPVNASNFVNLLEKYPHNQTVNFSVVGFGSKAYADFCAFAQGVDEALGKQAWAKRLLALHTVNDRSVEESISWIKAWNHETKNELAITPAVYLTRITGLKKFTVVEKTPLSEENGTFKIVLKPEGRQSFKSGDLLGIYPENRERLYSIGKIGGNIQLMVKHYPDGLGSGFLYFQTVGDSLSARVVINKSFHFPFKVSGVVMIANGTGIAPFLGMISENNPKVPARLYAGFRFNNILAHKYKTFADEAISSGKLLKYQVAFSREDNRQYVMDLIQKDAAFFKEHLASKGVIMICGSLAMQRDVEKVLAGICNVNDLTPYQAQILSDCY
jgi:sulfite reductase (NADPH) flavoprotein alpha-component